jgi:broad-specificity NMP kinase
MEEDTSMQVHIDKFQMIIDQLVNIDRQVFDQNLAHILSPFFHTLVVVFSTRINQLSMELICRQLLQEKLQCKQEL